MTVTTLPSLSARQAKAWRIRVARAGKLDRVPVKSVRTQVRALRRAGWSQTALAAELGVTQQSLSYTCVKARVVSRLTAEAVQALWEDCCARVPPDLRRWPVEPLHRALLAHYGSLKACPWTRTAHRVLSRGSMSTAEAERWAERLHRLPCEVWDDRYRMEEAG